MSGVVGAVSSDFGERLAPRQAAHDLVLGIALHLRIEHFEGAATGIGLVVMSKIRKPFEHAKKVLVPRTARILTLPMRHCELKGPNRVRLSPLSGAGVTVKPLSARPR